MVLWMEEEKTMTKSQYIEHRLRAALKYDVINGDEYDKAILAQQIQEAIQTIVSLRIALANAKHEGSPMILNNVKG
jgi:hypothetical protein